MQAVKNADINNGLIVHVAETGHRIKWDELQVIRREQQWT